MDPLTALALVQGGLGIASNFTQQEVQPENINPLTSQYYSDLLRQIAQLQSNLQGRQQGIDQAIASQQQTAGQAQRVAGDIEGMDTPDPNAWFQQFLGNVPEYQQIAQQAAEQATTLAGRGGQEQAEMLAQQAARQAAGAFAGSGQSGAARGAATEAALAPLADFQQRMAQTQANTFSSGLQQLLGQGQGLAQQSQQQAFANQLSALSQALGGLQTAGGLYGQAGQQALGNANLTAGLLQQALGNQAAMAEPVYSTPDYYNPLDRATSTVGLLSQFAANPNIRADVANLFKGSGTYDYNAAPPGVKGR